jgi:hypothetical protein
MMLLVQAPTNDTDFWFVVAQVLLAVLIAAGGYIINRALQEVSKLTERVDQVDRESTERTHQLQLEMVSVTRRLETLEKN